MCLKWGSVALCRLFVVVCDQAGGLPKLFLGASKGLGFKA